MYFEGSFVALLIKGQTLKPFGFLNRRNIYYHLSANPFPALNESYTRSAFESKVASVSCPPSF